VGFHRADLSGEFHLTISAVVQPVFKVSIQLPELFFLFSGQNHFRSALKFLLEIGFAIEAIPADVLVSFRARATLVQDLASPEELHTPLRIAFFLLEDVIYRDPILKIPMGEMPTAKNVKTLVLIQHTSIIRNPEGRCQTSQTIIGDERGSGSRLALFQQDHLPDGAVTIHAYSVEVDP